MVEYRLSFGKDTAREALVTYDKALRLLRVVIDGRVAYEHKGSPPPARTIAQDFKTPGPDTHTFVVEPPGAPDALGDRGRNGLRIWIDGQPVLRVLARDLG